MLVNKHIPLGIKITSGSTPQKYVTTIRVGRSSIAVISSDEDQNRPQNKFDKEIYFAGSTITSAWNISEPSICKTFVANRAAEINRNTHIDYRQHVNSKENPADVISRGLLPEVNSSLWWHGPLRLKNIDNYTRMRSCWCSRTTHRIRVITIPCEDHIWHKYSYLNKVLSA